MNNFYFQYPNIQNMNNNILNMKYTYNHFKDEHDNSGQNCFTRGCPCLCDWSTDGNTNDIYCIQEIQSFKFNELNPYSPEFVPYIKTGLFNANSPVFYPQNIQTHYPVSYTYYNQLQQIIPLNSVYYNYNTR